MREPMSPGGSFRLQVLAGLQPGQGCAVGAAGSEMMTQGTLGLAGRPGGLGGGRRAGAGAGGAGQRKDGPQAGSVPAGLLQENGPEAAARSSAPKAVTAFNYDDRSVLVMMTISSNGEGRMHPVNKSSQLASWARQPLTSVLLGERGGFSGQGAAPGPCPRQEGLGSRSSHVPVQV